MSILKTVYKGEDIRIYTENNILNTQIYTHK